MSKKKRRANPEKFPGSTFGQKKEADREENDCSAEYPLGGTIEPYDIEREKETQ